MKKLPFLFLLAIFFASCQTINVRDPETISRIMFKNLLKESEKINTISLTGFFKVQGVEEVPPAFIQFNSKAILKEEQAIFSLSFLKRPFIDIIYNNGSLIFVNHTAEQYLTIDENSVDFSPLLGVNFNPVEIYYILTGSIPYDKNMQLMTFSWDKKKYTMEITNNISKYTILLNKDEEIIGGTLNNQYYDIIKIDSISYMTNDDGNKIPKNVVFTDENENVTLTFTLQKITQHLEDTSLYDDSQYATYTKVSSFDEIIIDMKGM